MDHNIYVGKKKYLDDESQIGAEYLAISKADEEAAKILCQKGLYSQSVYSYIQSMEKYIKYFICEEIYANKQYFAQELRNIGHSLDKATDLLIKIKSKGDERMNGLLTDQIKNKIFRGIKFSAVYNSSRYPFYNMKSKNYSITVISQEDCKLMEDIYCALKKYLKQLIRI